MRADDLDPLHAAASDPLIWEQHSARRRHERAEFEAYFRGAMECGGGLVIADRADGQLIGASRFYDWNPADRSVVIGYTFLVRAHWGGATNREVKHLMLAHAFQWAERVWFHVSPGNIRSQRALTRIGASLRDEQDVLVDGVPSARLLFAIDR